MGGGVTWGEEDASWSDGRSPLERPVGGGNDTPPNVVLSKVLETPSGLGAEGVGVGGGVPDGKGIERKERYEKAEGSQLFPPTCISWGGTMSGARVQLERAVARTRDHTAATT
jgi:hypothetical protein